MLHTCLILRQTRISTLGSGCSLWGGCGASNHITESAHGCVLTFAILFPVLAVRMEHKLAARLQNQVRSHRVCERVPTCLQTARCSSPGLLAMSPDGDASEVLRAFCNSISVRGMPCPSLLSATTQAHAAASCTQPGLTLEHVRRQALSGRRNILVAARMGTRPATSMQEFKHNNLGTACHANESWT